MSPTEIPPAPEDRGFRDEVLRRIVSARQRVRVVAGELSAYAYPELQRAAHDAATREVRVTAYANDPTAEVLRSLQEAGVEVTVGRLRSFHHYLVIDDRVVLTSVKERTGQTTPTGSRLAVVSEEDPALVRAVVRYDEFLRRSAREHSARPRDTLNDLWRTMDEEPSLAYRVPLAENLLVLGGLTEQAARSFAREAREKVREALGEEGKPLGERTETALVNETALRTAVLLP